MKITVDLIRKVREETGAPMVRAKKVLEETKGNEKKAIEILKKEGFEKMAKKEDRATGQGLVATYAHHTGRVAAMVELLCETDFVAKNELFVKLANDLALQVASMNPENAEELLEEDFIKEPSKKVIDLVRGLSVKTGENIQVGRITRLEIGK